MGGPIFAVGAPYELNGAVYIFRGQDNAQGVDIEFSQRIAAEDLLTAGNLMSFGYSLSGGLDMDGNGYPDLVVGNFESDTVIKCYYFVHFLSPKKWGQK